MSRKRNIQTQLGSMRTPPRKIYGPQLLLLNYIKKNPDNQVSMYIIEPKWHFKIKITYKYTTVYKSCTVNKL
jgi:hypothetical protein